MDKGYNKLEIYNLAHELAIKIHQLSLSLPKFEMYEQGSQIRRSAKSIAANIVEGYCLRRHKNEFLQYLHHALGSCKETIYHLGILFETKSLIDETIYKELSEKYNQLGKMIFRFIETVYKEHLTPNYIKEEESNYKIEYPHHTSNI
ncbi:MAG: four helix bundle protein [Ignavibacteriales bacterium]|nr:four helix bundle protein [Ignavibacteriales bacterium]